MFLFNFFMVIRIFIKHLFLELFFFSCNSFYYSVSLISVEFIIPERPPRVTRSCTKFDYRFVRTSILRHFKSKGLTHTSPCVSNNGTLYIYAPTERPLSLDLSSGGKSGFQRPDQWLRRCSFLY